MTELTPEKIQLIAQNKRRGLVNAAIQSAVDKGWTIEGIKPTKWIVDNELFFRCKLPANGKVKLHFNHWLNTINDMADYLSDDELEELVMNRPHHLVKQGEESDGRK